MKNKTETEHGKFRINLQQLLVPGIFLGIIAVTFIFPAGNENVGRELFTATIGLVIALFAAELYINRENPQKISRSIHAFRSFDYIMENYIQIWFNRYIFASCS